MTLTLTALDVTNVPIHERHQTIPYGGGVHTVLDIQIAVTTIAAFTVTGTAVRTGRIDDLTFDNPTQPDFTLSPTQNPCALRRNVRVDTITIGPLTGFNGTLMFGATVCRRAFRPSLRESRLADHDGTFSALPTAPVSNAPQAGAVTATPTTIAAGQNPQASRSGFS